jgi:thiol-disulfide isomerase/thioredoxin
MSVIQVKNAQEFAKMMELSGKQLVVIKYGAEWCGPCKSSAAPYAAVASRLKNVKFCQVDVDQVKSVCSDVRGIPCFRFFKAGQQVCEQVTGADVAKVEELAKQYGGSTLTSSWTDIQQQGRTLSSQVAPATNAVVQSQSEIENEKKMIDDDDHVDANESLVEQLLELGIDRDVAVRACIQCNNAGFEEAVEFAFGNAMIDDDASTSSAATTTTTTTTTTMAAEEREQRALELQKKLAEERQRQRELDEKRAQLREIERIKSGKDAQELKEQFDAEQSQRDVDEQRRELEAERAYRRQVLTKIRLAKQQRAKDKQSSLLENVPAADVPLAAPTIDTSSHSTCKLQIRLPSGKRETHTFKADDTIANVIAWLESNVADMPSLFVLQTTMPVTKFIGDKVYTTLLDAGLTPRGMLVCKEQQFD